MRWLAGLALVSLVAPLALEAGETVPHLERYFPFRLGDSWTYDRQIAVRGGPPRKQAHTRVFDGTEFIGAGLAYRLVSDDGSYHLYMAEEGVVTLHTSAEAGRLFYYDPPVVLAAPDLPIGEPRIVEHPDTQRKWKTTLLGFEDVSVPLGRFEKCLKILLEMESPEYLSEAVHFYAPGVGLVAYSYRLLDASDRRPEIQIEAELRLARLSGKQVSEAADLAHLPPEPGGDGLARDDATARDALRRAIDQRYTWDAAFPGFRGDFEYLEEGKPPVAGSFVVGADLSVKIEAPSEAVQAALRNEISSFVSHRKDAPFDLTYAGTTFRKGASGPNGEMEIISQGDPTGAKHRIRGDELLAIERSVGRLRYQANNLKTIRTEDGRSIIVEYELVFLSNEDQSVVSRELFVDSYAKQANYWLPTGRKHVKRAGGKTSSFELRLTRPRY
jgi:hypothetical protein